MSSLELLSHSEQEVEAQNTSVRGRDASNFFWRVEEAHVDGVALEHVALEDDEEIREHVVDDEDNEDAAGSRDARFLAAARVVSRRTVLASLSGVRVDVVDVVPDQSSLSPTSSARLPREALAPSAAGRVGRRSRATHAAQASPTARAGRGDVAPRRRREEAREVSARTAANTASHSHARARRRFFPGRTAASSAGRTDHARRPPRRRR